MVVSVKLPDDLRTKIETRLAESGHSSIEQYVEALIRSDTETIPLNGPPGVTVNSRDELEALLLHRMDNGGPSIEYTPELLLQLKERARRSVRGKHP